MGIHFIKTKVAKSFQSMQKYPNRAGITLIYLKYLSQIVRKIFLWYHGRDLLEARHRCQPSQGGDSQSNICCSSYSTQALKVQSYLSGIDLHSLHFRPSHCMHDRTALLLHNQLISCLEFFFSMTLLYFLVRYIYCHFFPVKILILYLLV